MNNLFNLFMSQLAETNATLGFYSDFEKIKNNVDRIAISLNTLNYLLGKEDLEDAVHALWIRDKSVFNVLNILIATRKRDNKKFIDENGDVKLISSLFESEIGVVKFLKETGLAKVFRESQIHDLVDYVFGVETGLDTNARKNRSGDVTELFLHNLLVKKGIVHRREVYSYEFPQIQYALGEDKKRFDFVIETKNITYLIEINFYNGGGSKLNEVARAYREIAPIINNVEGFEFVWITDGEGWKSAENKLYEAFLEIPRLYNFHTLSIFLQEIKNNI